METGHVDASPQLPLGLHLDRLWADAPPRPAVLCGELALTFDDLRSRTAAAAGELMANGVAPDQFVTIGLPNSLDFIVWVAATWMVGATPQPVSAALPSHELEKIIALASPAALIGAAGPPGIPSLKSEHPPRGDTSPIPTHVAKSWKAPTSGGSTGRPKLIVDRRPATAETVLNVAALFDIRTEDTVLITAPLYHNAVFMTMSAALAVGAQIVVMPKFDPQEALQLVTSRSVTWMYTVPTMMHRIWRLDEQSRAAADISSLRIVYHLGAPCPRWLKREWIRWVGAEKIWELYAGTEAQAVTVINGVEWLEHEGSVGRPIIGDIEIRNAEYLPVASGTVGEVWLRPPPGQVAPYQYIGADARTHGDWESLGDMGWLDADGYLYLADRQTDMILSGGANIYPAEVEAALEEHPDVLSSCVIGLPDDDLGNRVHAIVQTSQPISTDVLATFLASRLVRYKVPRTFEFVDHPLRDAAGKVRRSALRAARTKD